MFLHFHCSYSSMFLHKTNNNVKQCICKINYFNNECIYSRHYKLYVYNFTCPLKINLQIRQRKTCKQEIKEKLPFRRQNYKFLVVSILFPELFILKKVSSKMIYTNLHM